MPRKALITSPVPSIEETAREVGLSEKRARQIAALMDDIMQRRLRRAARMKTVSIGELKRNPSSLIEQAAAGTRILITKHRRPVASLSAADMEHAHIGARFGRGALKPLLRGRHRESIWRCWKPAADR